MALLDPVASGSGEEASEVADTTDLAVAKWLVFGVWSDRALRSPRESQPGVFDAWLLASWSALAERSAHTSRCDQAQSRSRHGEVGPCVYPLYVALRGERELGAFFVQ